MPPKTACYVSVIRAVCCMQNCKYLDNEHDLVAGFLNFLQFEPNIIVIAKFGIYLYIRQSKRYSLPMITIVCPPVSRHCGS